MSQINRPPIGLQQLLGSQNFGDNPPQLGGVVAPTLDLLPFYGAGTIRYKQTSGARVNTGIISSVPVFGQIAILQVAAWTSGAISTGAGAYDLALTMQGIATADTLKDLEIPLVSNKQTLAVTDQIMVNYTFRRPFIVESGVSFNSRWLATAGANTTVRLLVVFYDISGQAFP